MIRWPCCVEMPRSSTTRKSPKKGGTRSKPSKGTKTPTVTTTRKTRAPPKDELISSKEDETAPAQNQDTLGQKRDAPQQKLTSSMPVQKKPKLADPPKAVPGHHHPSDQKKIPGPSIMDGSKMMTEKDPLSPAERRQLEAWDLDPTYGPCVGIRRLDRYHRSVDFGLAPDPRIGLVLDRYPTDPAVQHDLWIDRI